MGWFFFAFNELHKTPRDCVYYQTFVFSFLDLLQCYLYCWYFGCMNVGLFKQSPSSGNICEYHCKAYLLSYALQPIFLCLPLVGVNIFSFHLLWSPLGRRTASFSHSSPKTFHSLSSFSSPSVYPVRARPQDYCYFLFFANWLIAGFCLAPSAAVSPNWDWFAVLIHSLGPLNQSPHCQKRSPSSSFPSAQEKL